MPLMKRLGEWVVFDAKRFATYSAETELVCNQREARKAAFNIFRSAGGWRKGNATVVASVQSHGGPWGSQFFSLTTPRRI